MYLNKLMNVQKKDQQKSGLYMDTFMLARPKNNWRKYTA